MIYNLQLIYEQRKYCYTEAFIETETIYESPFNSYIMCHPTGDKELDENIRSSISEVLTLDRRDDINGYVFDILLLNDKISVEIINQQNTCEPLIKLPVDQVKNKWLAHQDFMTNFYTAVDTYITYENTSNKSSMSLKYVSSSKKMTSIEKTIIKAFNMFMSLHLLDDNSKHCTSIELERKSSHPIIISIIHDNIGYYKRMTINLKNIKTKVGVTAMLSPDIANCLFLSIRLLNEPILENTMMELVKNLSKNHEHIRLAVYWDINNDMSLTCVSNVKKNKLYGHYENGVTHITSHDVKFSSGELARYLSVNMDS